MDYTNPIFTRNLMYGLASRIEAAEREISGLYTALRKVDGRIDEEEMHFIEAVEKFHFEEEQKHLPGPTTIVVDKVSYVIPVTAESFTEMVLEAERIPYTKFLQLKGIPLEAFNGSAEGKTFGVVEGRAAGIFHVEAPVVCTEAGGKQFTLQQGKFILVKDDVVVKVADSLTAFGLPHVESDALPEGATLTVDGRPVFITEEVVEAGCEEGKALHALALSESFGGVRFARIVSKISAWPSI